MTLLETEIYDLFGINVSVEVVDFINSSPPDNIIIKTYNLTLLSNWCGGVLCPVFNAGSYLRNLSSLDESQLSQGLLYESGDEYFSIELDGHTRVIHDRYKATWKISLIGIPHIVTLSIVRGEVVQGKVLDEAQLLASSFAETWNHSTTAHVPTGQMTFLLYCLLMSLGFPGARGFVLGRYSLSLSHSLPLSHAKLNFSNSP